MKEEEIIEHIVLTFNDFKDSNNVIQHIAGHIAGKFQEKDNQILLLTSLLQKSNQNFTVLEAQSMNTDKSLLEAQNQPSSQIK